MIHRLEAVYRALQRLTSRNTWINALLPKPQNQAKAALPGTDHQQLHRGLLMIQIDGLSHTQMQAAMERGQLPFLASLLDHEHYHLHDLYSGMPSSTPAVQAELFYGIKGAVPAFAFVHRTDGELNVMYDPGSAQRVQTLLSDDNVPLLEGGSAYCDIYGGGASEVHFCSTSLGWGELFSRASVYSWIIICVLNIPVLLRTIGLMIVEFLLSVHDAAKGLLSGQKLLPEFKFISTRVAITILLRDLITMGAEVDIHRALPIIHLNYIGYDEQAHRRGPRSRFAHWALRGIDRRIELLWKASQRAHRRQYDVWVYSDHGQEATVPYASIAGESISDTVVNVVQAYVPAEGESWKGSSAWSYAQRRANSRVRLLGGRHVQHLFASQPLRGMNTAIPTRARADATRHALREHPLPDEQLAAVIAMGPVGHVYLSQPSDTADRTALASQLVQHNPVPMVMYLDEDRHVRVHTRSVNGLLSHNASQVFGPDHPFLQSVAEDCERLCRHDDAGDLVLFGWSKDGQILSFPEENGAHAGPGMHETHAFALLPSDTQLFGAASSYLRPVDLRRAALEILGKDSRNGRSKDHFPLFPEEKRSDVVRVMTYNVHSCIGMDNKIAPERIARVIARYRPDIVALQELDCGKVRTRTVNQAQMIARSLDMDFHFHPNINIDNERYGDAILTHLPLRHVKSGELPNHPTRNNCEPRGVQWVSVHFQGQELQVFNTHLGLFAAERREQVAELVSERWLNHPECAGPVIFCGDLNALPSSHVLKTLSSQLVDVQSRYPHRRSLNTFTGRVPTLRIDHILTRDIGSVHHIDVPYNSLTKTASDHLPLIADLIIG